MVDLASQAPLSGSYKSKDPMGLFSMAPVADDPASGNFSAKPPKTRASTVALTVTSGGQTIGHRPVTRTWMAPGDKARVLTPGTDQVSGELFTPPPGTPRHAGVLLFGGAEAA